MKHTGVMMAGECIYFVDPLGKDVSFDRWRVNCYYAPNLAMTHSLPSEGEYDAFLAYHSPYCYGDYQEFVCDWNKEGKKEEKTNAQG